MIKNLRHIGLVVSDMDRAIKFYQGLGFKVISRNGEIWGACPLEVCKMTHGLELIAGQWMHHFAVTVSDWPEIVSIIQQKSEELPSLQPCPDSITWRFVKPGVKFITDPDGNVIELVKEDEL